MVMSSNTQPTSNGNVLRKQNNGQHISVTCPQSIINYNAFMGGVHKGDQIRGYYRCRIKTRKFYKYIFFFLFDVAITNSYILYSTYATNKKLKTIKDFRLELSQQLIGSFSNRRRPGHISKPIAPLAIQHFPVRLKSDTNTTQSKTQSKRGRCAFCMKYYKKRTDTTL